MYRRGLAQSRCHQLKKLECCAPGFRRRPGNARGSSGRLHYPFLLLLSILVFLSTVPLFPCPFFFALIAAIKRAATLTYLTERSMKDGWGTIEQLTALTELVVDV
jgi:hypothetical protein